MSIFDEPQEMFRGAVRSFVEREVAPHVEEWEAAGRMPKSLWRRMGELGFLGVEYDEKYGGSRRFRGSKISVISPLGSRRRPALTSHCGRLASGHF